MSKKNANERELDKARAERKWKTAVSLINAFNFKSSTIISNAEEQELYRCLHLGEALLEEEVDNTDVLANNFQALPKEKLEKALSYLTVAAEKSKKFKEKHESIFTDAHLLLSKYNYFVGNYSECVDLINLLSTNDVDHMNRRTKYLLAETLTCKGLSLEHAQSSSRDGTDSDELALDCYRQASEVLFLLLTEDDDSTSGTLKRNASFAHLTYISPLLEASLLRRCELLLKLGRIGDLIEQFRYILCSVESRLLSDVRRVVLRWFSEVLLGCTCSNAYMPPLVFTESIASPTSPQSAKLNDSLTHALPSQNSLKSLKKSNSESLFCPQDEIEECLMLLMLAESMTSNSLVIKESQENVTEKKKVLNDIYPIFDLLTLALSRREQYHMLSTFYERNMKFAAEQFHFWFQCSLTLCCERKYCQALLVLKQCHSLQPENIDVLMSMIKLCINHLHQFEEAVEYGNRILQLTKDLYEEASARLAIGVAKCHLASKVNSAAESKKIMHEAITSIELAHTLDSNDVEILYHLACCQAISKKINTAVATIEQALSLNPNDLLSLHLLVLLLTAQKKHHEAYEVLEGAISEYSTDFSLLALGVRLTEELHGPQKGLSYCQSMLSLWNETFNETFAEQESNSSEPLKSSSFSLRQSNTNDGSRLGETASNLKKITLADGTSVYDEDGTSSIAASIRIEKALSESASGTLTLYNGTINTSTAIALLCKIWLLTAECFLDIGDTTEASGCTLEASAVFPLSPDVLYMRGRLNEHDGNREESIACYESALSINPNHLASSQRLGTLYRESGDFILAEQYLRNCIQFDPSNHSAWSDLGLILEGQGRIDESIGCFNASLDLEQTAPFVPFTTLPRLFRAFDDS